MRAQSSVELLFAIVIVIVLIASIYFFAFSNSSSSVQDSQAKDSVNRLAAAANYVGSLGEGATFTLSVHLPADISKINISGNRVVLRMHTPSGESDVFGNTKYTLLGSIPTTAGMHEIRITRLSNNRVFFGETILSCTPKDITASILQGSNSASSIDLFNSGPLQISNITASISGNGASLVGVGSMPAVIPAGGNGSVALTFSVPSYQEIGAYLATITVGGESYSECVSMISLFVMRTGGEDVEGPHVTSISHYPESPNSTQQVTVNVTADDSSSGNSTVSFCQVEADYSGIWLQMSPSDGSYNSPIENATFNLGSLLPGIHNVRVRCIDSAGNVGNATSYPINVGGQDLIGPIVYSLSITPASPNKASTIRVFAVGNDTTTGGSNISMCQVQIDGGAFAAMSATDGAYNFVAESVNYTIGTLNVGSHTIGVRCNDSFGNTGATYNITFEVTKTFVKNILIITAANGATTAEQYWITWISARNGTAGIPWTYDVASVGSVTGGTTNVSNYRIIVMPSAPASNPTLYEIINDSRSNNSYVVLVGGALTNAMNNLGVATGTGTSTSRNSIDLLINTHYITSGFNITTYNIISSNQAIFYNTRSTITNLATTNGGARYAISVGSNVVTYGNSRPDLHNGNGTTLAIRSIDYALINSN